MAPTDCDEVCGLPWSLRPGEARGTQKARFAATKGVAAAVGMTVNSNREVVEAAAPEGQEEDADQD